MDVASFPLAVGEQTGPRRITWAIVGLDYCCYKTNLSSGRGMPQLLKRRPRAHQISDILIAETAIPWHVHEYYENVIPCIAKVTFSNTGRNPV